MKKTLFTSILALCVASAAVADTTEEVTYNTTITASGANNDGGGYTGVYFKINEDIFSNASYVDIDTTLDDDSTVDATAFLTDTVSLDSVTIYSRGYNGNYTSSFSSYSYITISGSFYNEDGELESTSYSISSDYFTIESLNSDITSGAVVRAHESLTIDFSSLEADIVLGQTYYINFYDTDDNLVSSNLAASTNESEYSDGSVVYGLASGVGTSATTDYSPAEMSITVSSTATIPEPATATLSLVALAGLMVRRRRQA